MSWPPGERGAPTTESASLQNTACHDCDSTGRTPCGCSESVPLTPIERNLFRLCERAAVEWRQLEPTERLTQELRAKSNSTVPRLLGSLERKGLIRRRFYQRGRVVEIVATGQATADPPNMQAHWRELRRARHG